MSESPDIAVGDQAGPRGVPVPDGEGSAGRVSRFNETLVRLVAHKRSTWILAPLTGLVFIAVWEVVFRLTELSVLVLPQPVSIASALWDDVVGARAWRHTQATMMEVLAGFGLATVMGLVGGIAIARSRLIEAALYPYVVALQTMPKVAIAPLLVLWLGFGLESKVVIAALVAFFPLLVNVVTGMKSVDGELRDLMRVLGASKWQTFRRVELPSSLPVIFAGLELAMVFAIVGAIVGEFVGAQRGLGYLILQRNFALNVPGMWSVLVILALLGTGLTLVVRAVGRKVTFWHQVRDSG